MPKDIPTPLPRPDLAELIAACLEYRDFLAHEYEEDEASNYESRIFEAAIEAVFGDVWDWVNSRIP